MDQIVYPSNDRFGQMSRFRTHFMALACGLVVVLAVLADNFGVLTGVAHPLSPLRIAGFTVIALGVHRIMFRG